MAHPDFIIIGAQKAGTSWLHTNLRRHPAIWVPGTEMHAWRDWALPKYMDYYERPEPVTGEKGPEYFHMPGYAVKRMASDLPDTTFIALLRRPFERAWSQARMEGSTYNQEQAPGALQLFISALSVRNRLRTRYDRILKRWKTHAGDRLHIFYYDDLCDRPGWLLSQVCEVLNVDPITPPNDERIWASPKREIPPPMRAELQHVYRDMVMYLASNGFNPPDSWRIAQDGSARTFKSAFLRHVVHLASAPYYVRHHLRYWR